MGQIKSKERVSSHGEVFTNKREVCAMLDMVQSECERIESRFLEPACGSGNFLAEVLRRKLEVVKKRYSKSATDYERNAFLAVSSLYGVELLADNASECRVRLFKIFESEYAHVCKAKTNARYLDAIKTVIDTNILCGNALSMKMVDSNQNDTDEPIIFAEWSIVSANKVKRRDFRLDELIEGQNQHGQMSMFGASGSFVSQWEYDQELDAFIPLPIKEYPLVDIYEIGCVA